MAFPRTDTEFIVWLNNFAERFSTHGPALGFAAAEVTAVQNDAAMMQYLIGDLLPTYKSAVQARSAYKSLIKDGPTGTPGGDVPAPPAASPPPTTVAPGVVPRLRKLIQRIVAAPNYTEAIGKDLDIISTEGSSLVDTATAKPTAKVVPLLKSEVRIDFSKEKFDGVLIEGRRSGDSDWSELGTDHYSPYVDTRPPVTAGRAEVREYRLRYLVRDEAVGVWSDIISTSTTP